MSIVRFLVTFSDILVIYFILFLPSSVFISLLFLFRTSFSHSELRPLEPCYSFLLLCKDLFLFFLSVHPSVHLSVCLSMRRQLPLVSRGIRHHGARIRGNYEQTYASARNQTLVCSQWLNHNSSSNIWVCFQSLRSSVLYISLGCFFFSSSNLNPWMKLVIFFF